MEKWGKNSKISWPILQYLFPFDNKFSYNERIFLILKRFFEIKNYDDFN